MHNKLRLCIVVAALICSLDTMVCAQKIRPDISHNSELNFETNMANPIVPVKQSTSVKAHMATINDAISRIGFESELRRNGEVVTVTLPCSELFAANDTVLKNTIKNRLDHLSNLLQYPTMYKIVIAVYSDNTGEPGYCDHLTETRANAIDEYLLALANKQNVFDSNIIAYGMGQSDFKVENNSIDNRALNRRVEISIIPEWEMVETAKAGKLSR